MSLLICGRNDESLPKPSIFFVLPLLLRLFFNHWTHQGNESIAKMLQFCSNRTYVCYPFKPSSDCFILQWESVTRCKNALNFILQFSIIISLCIETWQLPWIRWLFAFPMHNIWHVVYQMDNQSSALSWILVTKSFLSKKVDSTLNYRRMNCTSFASFSNKN